MKTTCAYCGVGCGIRLSREGDNWQLQGDEQHPANGGALCVKGASLLESLAFPDRLLYPRWMGQRIGWDEALDTLKKSLKDTKLTSEEKEQLTTQLSDRISNITLETKLETLIKSKGFTDCVVNLEGSKANVTVMTESDALTAEEVTRIRDALLSQCKGLTAQDITIVEVK